MQICGLHRAVYRGARLSSRIEAKERSEAAKRSGERRELVDRWLQARRDGLTAEAACDRSTLRIALDIGHDRTRPGATSASSR